MTPGWPRMPEVTTDCGVERQCRMCGELWPLEMFPARKRCRLGRESQCMACRNEKRRGRVAVDVEVGSGADFPF